MAAAQLIAIMGSGELGPTMVRVHQQVLDRLAGAAGPIVALDTPYAFQENAAELSRKTVDYFDRYVGADAEVVALSSAGAAAAALDRVRAAALVFAGPGSPSYALRHWRPAGLAGILAQKLAGEGAVVFASAAAATLGRWALPVYEMYKAGADPYWMEGLDLLSVAGLAGVVVPHWDNAEGGTHDTSRCFVGRRRLGVLEEQLPPGAVVLGVDEHTAAIIDVAADSLAVTGKRTATVRRRGATVVIDAGRSVPLEALRTLGADGGPAPLAAAPPPAAADPAAAALGALESALDAGDPATVVELAVGFLEEAVTGTGNVEQARALMARLAREAAAARDDPVAAALPHLDDLLTVRERARRAGDYEAADSLRIFLEALGIEVRDTPDGARWERRPA